MQSGTVWGKKWKLIQIVIFYFIGFIHVFSESPGAFTEIKENIPAIPPQGALSHDVLVNPRQSLPNATIVATFSAQELLDVHGSLVLDIE